MYLDLRMFFDLRYFNWKTRQSFFAVLCAFACRSLSVNVTDPFPMHLFFTRAVSLITDRHRLASSVCVLFTEMLQSILTLWFAAGLYNTKHQPHHFPQSKPWSKRPGSPLDFTSSCLTLTSATFGRCILEHFRLCTTLQLQYLFLAGVNYGKTAHCIADMLQ